MRCMTSPFDLDLAGPTFAETVLASAGLDVEGDISPLSLRAHRAHRDDARPGMAFSLAVSGIRYAARGGLSRVFSSNTAHDDTVVQMVL